MNNRFSFYRIYKIFFLQIFLIFAQQVEACQFVFSTQEDNSGSKMHFAVRQEKRSCRPEHFSDFYKSLDTPAAQEFFRRSVQDYFSRSDRENWKAVYSSQYDLPDTKTKKIMVFDAPKAPVKQEPLKEFSQAFAIHFDPTKIGRPIALDTREHGRLESFDKYFESSDGSKVVGTGMALLIIAKSGLAEDIGKTFETAINSVLISTRPLDRESARQQADFIESVFSSLRAFQNKVLQDFNDRKIRSDLLNTQIHMNFLEIDRETQTIERQVEAKFAQLEDLTKSLRSGELAEKLAHKAKRCNEDFENVRAASRKLLEDGFARNPEFQRRELFMLRTSETSKSEVYEVPYERSYNFKTERTSNEGEKLAVGLAQRNTAADKLALSQTLQMTGIQALEAADRSLDLADEHYHGGDIEAGDIAFEIATGLLDVATSLTPGVSWARDSYEAVVGLDLITGKKLDTFSRSMAVLGVATGGVGSKIGKSFKMLKRLMKGEKAAEAIQNGEKVVEVSEQGWSSVKGLLHTIKGNTKLAADGTYKLKNGMHTEKGLEHFLKLNAGKGKKYTFETVSSFGEKNLAEGVILKQTLPNGVTRLQLPREAWHNQPSFSNARFATDSEKWKGIKTLWPNNFTIKDINQAAEHVLAQNLSTVESTLEGVFKGIQTVAKRDQTGKIITVYPKWIQ